MKSTVKALKSKYSLFIVSIIGIIALQVGIEYWFDSETMFSLVLSAITILVIILEFMYVFLPSVNRLSSVNRKLVRLRKDMEERERQYRELVEGATDIIYELNSQGEFSFVNEHMLVMSGYSHEELMGRSYFDLIHPDDRAYAGRFYRDQLKAGKENSYLEFRMIGKHDQIIWIGQNVRYFYDQSWVTKVRVVARDITQGRQAQLALQQLKEEAENTTRAKSQFLSMMSHEIRTPMNAIIGLTNLLSLSKLTDEQRENVQLLKFSGENLLTIINDILDFSKIEAQKIVLENIDFEIRQLIGKTILIHNRQAAEKGISLKSHIDAEIPTFLKGDPVRIIQIVTNLLTNAIKFTPEGNVELTLTFLVGDKDKVTLEIVVKDSGIGIPEDKLETIFESFSQAEDATTRKYGGTGLGLAITKKLVDLMQGKIEVASTLGKGSAFMCTLTLDLGTDPSSIVEGESEILTLPEGARVLIAEDNVMNQRVAVSFLRNWNLETTLAGNGQEALELLMSKSFDLVLMDLQMPEMSGYEATAKIRAMDDAYYKTVPIIALTASAMAEVKEQVLAAGMNDFLSKPFQPQELRQILIKYIKPKVFKQSVPESKWADNRTDLVERNVVFDNLVQLESAFTKSIADNDSTVFLDTVRNSKNELSSLNNPILSEMVTTLELALTNHSPRKLDFRQRAEFMLTLSSVKEHLLG